MSVKHRLGGSIPSAPTTKGQVAQLGERHTVNMKGVGSYPTLSAKHGTYTLRLIRG